jgi:hypothetical protein
MNWGDLLRRLFRGRARPHRGIKQFDHELKAAGDLTGRADLGHRTVDVHQIVGSVSRWQNLRSDFFYRTGEAMTARFVRIGQAMREGKILPPLELYKLKRRGPAGQARSDASEYYVVDGHHRVAMARKLGQDYLDARVVEYRVTAPAEGTAPSPAAAPADPPAGSPAPAGETRPPSPPPGQPPTA